MLRILPISYAARNLGRSPTRLMLSVGGAALVAVLSMAGAGFAIGMSNALRASGYERNVVLLGAGSEESVERSEITPSSAGVVAASLSGISTLDGRPLASPEINVALSVVLRSSDSATHSTTDAADHIGLVRGITPAAFIVHPQARLVAGRAPQPGAPAFVEPGDTVTAETVVGIVETMKLMNPVYAGVAGTVDSIPAANAVMVAAGTALVRIRQA